MMILIQLSFMNWIYLLSYLPLVHNASEIIDEIFIFLSLELNYCLLDTSVDQEMRDYLSNSVIVLISVNIIGVVHAVIIVIRIRVSCY